MQIAKIRHGLGKLELLEKRTAKQDAIIDSLLTVQKNWKQIDENDSIVIANLETDLDISEANLKKCERKNGVTKKVLIGAVVLAVLEGLWIGIQAVLP